jgi:hypothetical protein
VRTGDRSHEWSGRRDFRLVAAWNRHKFSSGTGKGKPMKISRKDLLAAIAVSAVLLLSFRAASPQQSSPQLSSEQIAQIVASPDRSEADRTNDLRRKPEQMLAFMAFVPVSSRSISARPAATPRSC